MTALTPTSNLLPRGFSPTYARLDIRRVLRNRRAMIFTLVMPTLMYVVFGAAQSYGHEKIGSANAAAYVMIHMAIYGAILATAANGASVALEQQAGWTRTLRLTPLSPGAYVMTKVIVALSIAAMPVILLSIVGAMSGARAPVGAWVAAVLLGWLGSSVFAAFGLAVGSALKAEAAMQVQGGLLTLLAFAGNVFVPMSGHMLTFAQFTPMYGVNALATYPITGGATVHGDHVSLLGILANVAVWGAIMVAAAIYFFRRGTERQ
jgi:ABC-2 type transport system permease protein